MDPVARGIAALYAASIPVVTPAGWGAQVDYAAMARRPVDREDGQRFIHWVGPSTSSAAAAGNRDAEAAALRSAERYHLGLGWAGLAYDVSFGNSGTCYLVRGDAQSAATSGDVDMDGIPNNVEGDALLFIVGAGQTVTRKALTAARVFLGAHGRGPVIPHHGARGTSTECPGPQLTEFARTYRPQETPVDVVILLHPSEGTPDALAGLGALFGRPDQRIGLVVNADAARIALREGKRVYAVGGPACALVAGDTDLRGVNRLDTQAKVLAQSRKGW